MASEVHFRSTLVHWCLVYMYKYELITKSNLNTIISKREDISYVFLTEDMKNERK